MEKYYYEVLLYGGQKISIDYDEMVNLISSSVEKDDGFFKTKSGLFSTKSIVSITVDLNRVMGWNPSHKLDGHDDKEIAQSGIVERAQEALYASGKPDEQKKIR